MVDPVPNSADLAARIQTIGEQLNGIRGNIETLQDRNNAISNRVTAVEGLNARVVTLEGLEARILALENLNARLGALEGVTARVVAIEGLIQSVVTLEINQTLLRNNVQGPQGVIQRVAALESEQIILSDNLQGPQGLTERVVTLEGGQTLLSNNVQGLNGLSERVDRLENPPEKFVGEIQRKAEMKRSEARLLAEVKFVGVLNTILTNFSVGIPVFAGFLGVLFAVTIPCTLIGKFLFLGVMSGVGSTVFLGVAVYLIWRTGRQYAYLVDYHDSISLIDVTSNVVSSHNPLGETADKLIYHRFQTWRRHVCPYITSIIIVYFFSVGFAAVFGTFLQSEKCANELLQQLLQHRFQLL